MLTIPILLVPTDYETANLQSSPLDRNFDNHYKIYLEKIQYTIKKGGKLFPPILLQYSVH